MKRKVLYKTLYLLQREEMGLEQNLKKMISRKKERKCSIHFIYFILMMKKIQ